MSCLAAQGLRGDPATRYDTVPEKSEDSRLRPYVFGGRVVERSTRESDGVAVQLVRFELARGGLAR